MFRYTEITVQVDPVALEDPMSVRRLLAGLPLFVGLVIPCFAQSDQTPPPAAAPDVAAKPVSPATSTPPKKVWTNEDVHKDSSVSVVGDKRNQNYHMTPQHPADAATVSRIRTNLEKLNAQLDNTNQKLTALKNFQAGEPSKDTGETSNSGINRVPVDQQIVKLEASKKKLETQIGDLLDEARKKGVDPGQLR